METCPLNKEIAMTDLPAYDTSIRRIKPGDDLPAPSDRLPAAPAPPVAPTAVVDEWNKILSGLVGK